MTGKLNPPPAPRLAKLCRRSYKRATVSYVLPSSATGSSTSASFAAPRHSFEVGSR